jgi:hypothetical protein
MQAVNRRFTQVAILSVAMMLLASCTNEHKQEPTAAAPREQSSVTTQPGVAGGVAEEVTIVQAVVTAIDVPTRRVTLKGPEGNEITFTARPEIKNLPQVQVGDKVTATLARRLTIVVRSDDAAPDAKLASARNTALKGEKPGMLVAEEAEITARVKAIDHVARTAVLEFSDGEQRTVPVRPDVDLTKYHAGDNVIIRATTSLRVLVES